MTGFGRAKNDFEAFGVTVEIKSVNHRFFEFSSKTPRAYMFLDEKLKSLISKRVSRGKIEVSVIIENKGGNSVSLELNKDYADAYIKALKSLGKKYRIKDDLKVSSLVNNSELFTVKKNEIDEETITQAVLKTTEEALDVFVSMRGAEGERLKEDVINRANYILDMVSFIEQRSPETVKEYRLKLEEKMHELLNGADVDEQRLLTETAIFADKVAVDEETVRLKSHINELTSLLNEGGTIGRKLDFIVQEMNREANTTGSKASDIEIAKKVIDIKAEIEKIREQIQNIE